MLFLYFVVLIIFLLLRYYYKRPANLPPGPPQLPLIGSLLSVLSAHSTDPAKAFGKLSKKYGPIVSARLGSVPVVAICGHEMLNRINNVHYDLLSRADENDTWLLEKTASKNIGLVFALPEFWAEGRAFSVKTLKKYDFTDRFQTTRFIMDEIIELCGDFNGQLNNGQATLLITDQFGQMFFNIMWIFLVRKKYGRGREKAKELVHHVEDFMSSSKFGGSVSQIYPALIKIFPELTGYNKLKQSGLNWRNAMKAVVAEAYADGEYRTHPTNFLEDFLHKVHTAAPSKNSIYTDDNVVAVMQDLTIGGTDTQAHLMKYMIRYMIDYPEIQDRLYEEVNRVIGTSRLIDVDDVPNLHYVQATMTELYRHVSLVPTMVRKLLEDWRLEGYVIPKGTTIILNLWSADNDEKVYKDPSVLNPTRFLSEDGKFVNPEKLFAFGIGKRRCLGDQLAKTSMILTVATLVQKFSFHEDPKFGRNWGADIFGMTKDAPPFSVIIKSREN